MPAKEINPSLCERYVIFLDIDGVLLPVPRFTFGGGELTASCVERLQQIIDNAGGKEKVTIILSSTWRNSPEMVQRLNRYFKEVVGDAIPCVEGGTPNGTIIISQVTYYPNDPTEQRLVRDRVDEIYRWIHTHITDHPEAIGGRWFAIDDMQLDVDARMAGHFLKTETEVGLTEDNVEQARGIISSFPTKEVAVEKSKYALVDPTLKDEEIEILKIQRDQLQEKVNDLEKTLSATKEELASLAATRREMERELKDRKMQMEDMGYRLALAEFSKNNKVLAAALAYATTTYGKERKEVDAKIRDLVALLRSRKELDKAVRSEMRKMRKASIENA
ncbi:unnamed protein product [Phytomonas sp. EM1]|nr:unnamed protein product [Phytomonas sp. EM1]|eukprot:CCW62511.1 unnamed protein product [Phytomonas sp. isolate EM1]